MAQQRVDRYSAPASTQAPVPGRDDEFYLTDEMTVFQVENVLFRVPQCIFSLNSLVFSTMFSLPSGDDNIEGRSDENPICLSGVTVLEFGSLLQYLFKGMNDNFYLPQSSWIALLSIAHRHEFENVFKRAIREIFDRPPSSRGEPDSDLELSDLKLISVAEKYDVPFDYVLPNLVVLVMRKEPLTEVEVSLLSPLTVSRLARAREDFLCKAMGRPSSLGAPMPLGGSFFSLGGPTAYGGGPASYGGPTPYGGSFGSPMPLGGHSINSFGVPTASGNSEAVAMRIVREIWLGANNDG